MLISPWKNDFPIFSKAYQKKRLAYLDNAASTQKPFQVIERLSRYYSSEHANVHRGIYSLSQKATDAYEEARNKVKRFINAHSTEEIIFTGGTTDGLNLLAYSYALNELEKGDEIILSHMEHHSNIVPWQIIARKTSSQIKVIRLTPEGELDLDHLYTLLNEKTKIISVVHVSNSLGTINPIEEIIQAGHRVGAKVIIDAAQSLLHFPMNVEKLDIDFLVFSGHKLLGPTGIGALYGKKKYLEKMKPFKGGGEMILNVTFDKTTYADPPNRFEAGTPHIAGAIGLGEAIDYIFNIGFDQISMYEKKLQKILHRTLSNNPYVQIFGPSHKDHRVGIFSFIIEGIHPHDIGTIIDEYGVAVRVGHHCTQPVMDHFQIPATVRASLSFYNDEEDIQQFEKALEKSIKVLK